MSTSPSKMRNWSVSLSPTDLARDQPQADRDQQLERRASCAPTGRASAPSRSSASRRRSRSPRDASAVPNTAMLAASRSDRIRYGIADRGEDHEAAHRRRARLQVVLGRALLADVLAELARRAGTGCTSGPRKIEISSEASPAIRISPISRCAPALSSAAVTRSSPTPRDPFTSTTSPVSTGSAASAAASLRVRRPALRRRRRSPRA